jgi:hypothetical protein
MPGSAPFPGRIRTRSGKRFSLPPVSGFHPSVDLAGRAVAISPDVPALFDEPLAPHHKLIGRWVAGREPTTRRYTRPEARAHIERVFDAAVMDVLRGVDLADFTVAILHSEEDGPPAIAIICQSMGALDLGWIKTGDAPVPWRAAAYKALDLTLGRVLPIFGYSDLFETLSLYYWDGETDDEAARQNIIDYHGVGPDEIERLILPSDLECRRPDWMIAANAAPASQLPPPLRRALRNLHQAHRAVGKRGAERDAWHFDCEIAEAYIPDCNERSLLPPLTLVPADVFGREIDDVGRHGMELGFMDIAGLLPLPDAVRLDDWFASLKLGVRFLCTAQDLLNFDPNKV